MANRIIYKEEAEKFLHENGWKLFLDMIIKDKAIVLDEPKVKILYNNGDYMQSKGQINLELWPEGLVLWVGGRIVWKEQIT